MKLVHATLASNLPSILKEGLLCSKSQGEKPVVWACLPSQTAWSVLHVMRRHNAMPQDVVVLELDVPRAWMKKHGGAAKGLYYSDRDVPPLRILLIQTFGLLSRSPTEEPEE